MGSSDRGNGGGQLLAPIDGDCGNVGSGQLFLLSL